MNAVIPVAVAPNFHVDSPADRLLVADGSGWRGPTDEERAAIVARRVTSENRDSVVLLFTISARLRTACWTFLEQGAENAGFGTVAVEIAEFLTFKQLPLPPGARFELVLQGPNGTIAPGGLWAIINLSDEPNSICLPAQRLSLRTGEGCRLPAGIAADIVPPEGDTPALVLVLRQPEDE